MRTLIAALLLISAPAWATQYLPEPDAATAKARSITRGVQEGVTDGAPWWGWLTLPCTNGPAVFLTFEDVLRGPGYDFTVNGLTDNEKAALVPTATMQANGCLP